MVLEGVGVKKEGGGLGILQRVGVAGNVVEGKRSVGRALGNSVELIGKENTT